MKAGICFLTWNRLEYTKQSLQSIIDNTDRKDYELIVWDNGSTEEGMVNWLRDICKKNNFLYLFFKRNEGMTRAMNNQMKYLKNMFDPDVYCHIANDIVVPKNWLNGVFDAIKVPKVGLVGLNFEYKNFEKETFDNICLDKIEPDGNVSGAHLCIPKKIYDLIGGFRHVQFGYGQQDANLSLEVKLLPYGYWDYYLPKQSYNGIHLEVDHTYTEYDNKKMIRLKQSGSDAYAGRNYRQHLRNMRKKLDKKEITEQQFVNELRQMKDLDIDKSQLLETNFNI